MRHPDSRKDRIKFVSAVCTRLLAVLLAVGATVTTFASPGDLDLTFSADGRLTDGEGRGSYVSVQPDGKIVVINGLLIARYDPDGTPDTSFGGGTGKVSVNLGFGGEAYIVGFVVQPDGRIAVGGLAGTGPVSFSVVRFDADGSLDLSFGGGTGRVSTGVACGNFNDDFGADFAIQPDGKMVGSVYFQWCNNGQLIRYQPDGSLDPSFGANGIVTTAPGYLDAIAFQSDGKLVLNGNYRILRFETNGSPDLGFNVSLQGLLHAYSVVVQPDQKIVAVGRSNNSSNWDFGVVRYNADGTPDTSFAGDGSVATPIGFGGDVASSAAIQADGKIVAAGHSESGLGVTDFALVRYNSDGSLDSTFGGGDGIATADFDNSSDEAWDLARDTTGQAVVVGVSYLNGSPRLAIARFLLNEAEVSIYGRVTTANGRGIGNAVVSMIDSLGVGRTARTSAFGYYSFRNIPGGTYNIAIRSKRYEFEPRTVFVDGILSGLDFVALN